MQQIVRALPLFLTLALAGCSWGPSTSDVALGPTLNQPNPALATPQITPASVPSNQTVQTAETALTDVTAYLDPAVIGKLSPKEKAEAASAQFNALTFGRPGAPRAWSGDRGASGSVTVGPYVRVNSIDCRDFTHTVTLSGGTFSRKGTACRDAAGSWSVAG
jgi:surface antigen